MERYRDGVALVTGAASGIGRGIALRLAHIGARVIAADIDEAGLAALGDGAIVPYPLDVRDAAAFRGAAEAVLARFGRIDYLFNVAGVAAAGELYEVSPEAWRRLFDVNLMGTVNGIAAVYPIMIRARAGHIVNMASALGLMPAPLLAPYAASKAAIASLSESLRLEAKRHAVRVTLVCPGFVETEIYRRGDVPANFGPDPGGLVPFKKLGVDSAVRAILKGVARNRARVVFPALWRWCWRLWRISPVLFAPAARIMLAIGRARIARAGKP